MGRQTERAAERLALESPPGLDFFIDHEASFRRRRRTTAGDLEGT
jgi:hypothetical protein